MLTPVPRGLHQAVAASSDQLPHLPSHGHAELCRSARGAIDVACVGGPNATSFQLNVLERQPHDSARPSPEDYDPQVRIVGGAIVAKTSNSGERCRLRWHGALTMQLQCRAYTAWARELLSDNTVCFILIQPNVRPLPQD